MSTLPTNHGKAWTNEEELRLLLAYRKGTAVAQIARDHGRILSAIQCRLEKLIGMDWRSRDSLDSPTIRRQYVDILNNRIWRLEKVVGATPSQPPEKLLELQLRCIQQEEQEMRQRHTKELAELQAKKQTLLGKMNEPLLPIIGDPYEDQSHA